MPKNLIDKLQPAFLKKAFLQRQTLCDQQNTGKSITQITSPVFFS